VSILRICFPFSLERFRGVNWTVRLAYFVCGSPIVARTNQRAIRSRSVDAWDFVRSRLHATAAELRMSTNSLTTLETKGVSYELSPFRLGDEESVAAPSRWKLNRRPAGSAHCSVGFRVLIQRFPTGRTVRHRSACGLGMIMNSCHRLEAI
jgi:hypothetical protein